MQGAKFHLKCSHFEAIQPLVFEHPLLTHAAAPAVFPVKPAPVITSDNSLYDELLSKPLFQV